MIHGGLGQGNNFKHLLCLQEIVLCPIPQCSCPVIFLQNVLYISLYITNVSYAHNMYNDCVIACPLQSIPSKQQSGSDSGGRAMRVRSKPVKYVISDEESGSSDWQQISDGSDSDFN